MTSFRNTDGRSDLCAKRERERGEVVEGERWEWESEKVHARRDNSRAQSVATTNTRTINYTQQVRVYTGCSKRPNT